MSKFSPSPPCLLMVSDGSWCAQRGELCDSLGNKLRSSFHSLICRRFDFAETEALAISAVVSES